MMTLVHVNDAQILVRILKGTRNEHKSGYNGNCGNMHTEYKTLQK
jgi:hypothetical protein